jgi:hypothetical protein
MRPNTLPKTLKEWRSLKEIWNMDASNLMRLTRESMLSTRRSTS